MTTKRTKITRAKKGIPAAKAKKKTSVQKTISHKVTPAKSIKKITPKLPKKPVKKTTIKSTLKASSQPKATEKRITAKAKIHAAKTAKNKAKHITGATVVSTGTRPSRQLTAPSYQELVGESKYYAGEAGSSYTGSNLEMPQTYGENRVILLVRDPYWMYACWEITEEKIVEIKNYLQKRFDDARLVLRVKDITNKSFTDPNHVFDIEIPGANNWYINVPNPDATYCVELGYLTRDNEFILIARSNIVSTPRACASDIYADDEFSAEDYDRIYALSGGLNIGLSSGELRKEMREKLAQELSSGQLSSLAASQFMQKREQKAKDFFLVVNTELIVYGATVPSAKLTIQGKPKKLNQDGTFSARFALPDGNQVIPICSTSQDGTDSITITPKVDKKTN